MRIRKGKEGWMVIKIDMEKVYDHLLWDFIKDTLEVAKIPSSYVRLIMQCISSPTMQILWNGGFTEEFVPSREECYMAISFLLIYSF